MCLYEHLKKYFMETELNEIEIPKKIKQASLLVYVSLIVGLLKSALYETMTNQKNTFRP